MLAVSVDSKLILYFKLKFTQIVTFLVSKKVVTGKSETPTQSLPPVTLFRWEKTNNFDFKKVNG
jgi:hypothetical protein